MNKPNYLIKIGIGFLAIVLAVGLCIIPGFSMRTNSNEGSYVTSQCGDINNDGNGPDIADLVYFVDFMFQGGFEPEFTCLCDVNCDRSIDIADLVYLVDYMFQGGPALCTDCCNPEGSLTGMIGCKTFETIPNYDVTPPDQDCIEYNYDGEGTLLLTHVNAGFNCCPEIETNVIIEDNTIIIEEIEILGECDCLCLFDLYYEIINLQPGEYTITVIEPYVPPDEETLSFTVDLELSPSGSYCVYRDFYPWGIY